MNKIIELGIKEDFKKKTQILSEGFSSNNLFYVESGLLRVYYLKDGKEITDWFGTEGSFITSIKGYYNNQKSNQYVEALEDSIVFCINKESLEKECITNPELEREYRQIVVNHLIRLQERITALQFYSASERYDLLLSKNPSVVKRVSRTHIASYLGVSLETLSRVSSKIII